jgi:hypothetical protein
MGLSVFLALIYQNTEGQSGGKENNGARTGCQITKNTPFHVSTFFA